MPKKIGPLDQKQAIIVFVLVAVGVFVFLKYRSKGAAASQLSTASVPTDGSQGVYPQQAQDATGGASGSGSDQLAALLSQFATTPPYYYNYSVGDTTTSTTTNYYGQGATPGSGGTGGTGGSTTSPPPPSGSPFPGWPTDPSTGRTDVVPSRPHPVIESIASLPKPAGTNVFA